MMKKLFLGLFIVFLITGSAYATYTLQGFCVDRQCEICDKKLVEWTDSRFESRDAVYSSMGICIGGYVEQLNSGLEKHYVCEECFSLYGKKYQKLMQETDKKFMIDAINGSLKRRAVNRDKNKSDALKKLRDQTKEIERQIRELDK